MSTTEYVKTVEVKRGTPVPKGSKWLSSRRCITHTEEYDNHPQLPPEEVHTYGDYDLYEIPCNEKGEY